MHLAMRQNFSGKAYTTFYNIRDPVICRYQYELLTSGPNREEPGWVCEVAATTERRVSNLTCAHFSNQFYRSVTTLVLKSNAMSDELLWIEMDFIFFNLSHQEEPRSATTEHMLKLGSLLSFPAAPLSSR